MARFVFNRDTDGYRWKYVTEIIKRGSAALKSEIDTFLDANEVPNNRTWVLQIHEMNRADVKDRKDAIQASKNASSAFNGAAKAAKDQEDLDKFPG